MLKSLDAVVRRQATGRLAALFVAAVSLGIGSNAHAADAAAGAEKAKAVCGACHGVDGNGVATFPDYPRLAGQHEEYLVQALKQYKSGGRKNAIMAGMAQPLSASDIENVAAWFASQTGPLKVIR
jgi:cytochrome c553